VESLRPSMAIARGLKALLETYGNPILHWRVGGQRLPMMIAWDPKAPLESYVTLRMHWRIGVNI